MELLPTEILVVENDADIVEHLCSCLKTFGYKVVAKSGNAKEAVSLALKFKPHLVIMDVVLDGDMDGVNAAEAIMSTHDIPVVYLGSYDDMTLMDRSRIYESYAYILNPCREEELHIAIEMALYRHNRDSDLKEIKEQLLQSEKLATIGQLAAGVAHEINNPIGYINSNMGALENYLSDIFKLIETYQFHEKHISSESAIDSIKEIKRAIDLDYLVEDIGNLVKESKEGMARVTEIIQDLKDFSRAHKDEWAYADIHHGIDSTLNIVHNEIRYKAKVIKHYGSLPHVECIPSQLNQVFMNLLVNAVHAIEEHGTITITTSMIDIDTVKIEITDDGEGIQSEILEKIFNPFFSTKPAGKGTGLGLSLSYSIVERHAGSIDVASEVGQGTTFTIKLPISQAEPKAER